MSRFCAMRTSDNDSEYSSSHEGGMGGQIQNREQAQAVMLMYDSSSSEEEKLRHPIRQSFEQLGQVMDKSRTIIQKNGVPCLCIQTICNLDLRVNEVDQDKDVKAKMSTVNNKALNTLRQKLRKNSKEHERFIAEYRAAPDAQTEDEPESESEFENGS